MVTDPRRLSKRELNSVLTEYVVPIFKDHPNYSSFVRKCSDGRVIFYLDLLSEAGVLRPDGRVVDLGAGLSIFPVLLRQLGLEVSVVDDFKGGGGIEKGQEEVCQKTLNHFQEVGISVISQNLLSEPLPFQDCSVDVVASFHSIEHWHHSPRRLFSEISRILKLNGLFVIGCPNAVNLRKRLWVLCGKTNLCSLDEWYCDGDPVFRGHVREPTVKELKQLLEWNGFAITRMAGRNFLAKESLVLRGTAGIIQSVFRACLSVLDPILQLRPTLCSDIHIVGRRCEISLLNPP